MTQGQELRDAALWQVAEHNSEWSAQALILVLQGEVKPHIDAEFTGEDLNAEICFQIGYPKHHNAKGSLIMRLVKGKIIEKTGVWVQAKAPTSHARMSPLYRWSN